jgi:hypothetical protein
VAYVLARRRHPQLSSLTSIRRPEPASQAVG